MAIKIKSLEKIASTINADFFFKDLTLDITQSKNLQPGFKTSVPGADIQVSFDTKAIINSLTNLFNTLPGQRFLFPEYGLDLHQFLFEPITITTGEMIGDKINSSIEKFEPRVTVKKILVNGNPDQNAYIISLFLEIPVLQTNFETRYNFDLRKQSIILIPTVRNT